jgi:hypothetical protein
LELFCGSSEDVVNVNVRLGGVTVTCQASGLFSHLEPQASLSREEVRHQVEVMRPDFRVELRNVASGQVETGDSEL